MVDFRLRPEERINEVHLATQLGLSRTPVREALNRLATEGFLTLSPNRGFSFRAVEIDDLVHLFELRSIVETGAFRLSCTRGDRVAAKEVRDFWKPLRRTYANRNPDDILGLDETFHLKLAAVSGNPEIVHAIEGINARIRFVRRIQIERGPRHASMVEEHTAIVEALLGRDAEAGVSLLRAHIAMTIEDARLGLEKALLGVAERQGEVGPEAD